MAVSGALAGAARLGGRAGEFFRFAGSCYCADRIVRREDSPDQWTRLIDLSVGVTEPTQWRATEPALRGALEFLTGDRWTLRFRKARDVAPAGLDLVEADVACLFSGGLDSLCGAIALLEEGKRVALVGHYEGGRAPRVQSDLARALAAHYGADRVLLRQLHLAPAPANPRQVRPLPSARENTTRGRSFLFIGIGVAVAASIRDGVPLYIPENGFIGINVPLDRTRVGSLSTRTTHPWFLGRVRIALDGLGIDTPLINPFRLMTKGEILAACANSPLLGRLTEHSISCSHPEWLRWKKKAQTNCGFCFPCLIRRASLHAVGSDVPAQYAFDPLSDRRFLDFEWESGASLRAIVSNLSRSPRALDVIRNGPIPNGERAAFDSVYRRGRSELRALIDAKGRGPLRARLGAP